MLVVDIGLGYTWFIVSNVLLVVVKIVRSIAGLCVGL